MTRIGCAVTSPSVSHVARYALEAIERAAQGAGLQAHRTPLRHPVVRRLALHLAALGGVRAMRRSGRRAVLVPMMGLLERAFFPWTYRNEIVPIVFDCLPGQFEQWQRVFRRNQVRLAFFSASAVAERFRREMGDGTWLWLPEAIDIDQYSAGVAWAERGIDCLEVGRRHAPYHELIASRLAATPHRHLFEKQKGELVFGGKADFLSGLAHSKISVCFPQSLTHPERFGAVETLTQRYLESMASGCIVLGRAPRELVQLFGYDPIVAVDWNDPVGQIESIVNRPSDHAALRARNLRAVREHGSWQVRIHDLMAALAEHGYRP